MRKKTTFIKETLFIALSLLLLFSIFQCKSFITVTATAQNVTSPVLVGPVMNINGKPVMNFGKEKDDFDVEVIMAASYNDNVTYIKEEDHNKIDVELLKLISSSKDKVIVDEVYVGSQRTCHIFCVSRSDWVGIEGRIYDAK